MKYGSKEYISYACSFLFLNLVLFYLTSKWLFIYLLITSIIPLFIPLSGVPLVGLWKKVTAFIGKINGIILLSIIFYLLLTPLALLRKLLSKKNATKDLQNQSTFFDTTEKIFKATDLEKMW